MKTYRRQSRDFAIWCLILALPFYIAVPFLLRIAGADWHFQCTAWGKTHEIDMLAVLSPVLFGYLAFVTFPKFQSWKSAEPSAGGNAAPPRASA